MKNIKTKSTIFVKTADDRVLDIPTRVFSTAAQCLRWDAVRSGELSPEQWSGVQAFVSTVCLDENEPTREFAICIVIESNGKAIRRIYKPGELERFNLYVESKLPGGLQQDSIELHMMCDGRLRVPLSKIPLPFASDGIVRRNDSGEHRDIGPPRLVLTHDAMKNFKGLYWLARRREVELGGCLLGQVPDPDTIIVSDVIMLPVRDDGSPDHVVFDPRLWIQARQCCIEAGNRIIIGFVHSHLIDERGHPNALSLRDKIIAHNFFSAPWSVMALVCVARVSPCVKLYFWNNGVLTVLNKEPEYRM